MGVCASGAHKGPQDAPQRLTGACVHVTDGQEACAERVRECDCVGLVEARTRLRLTVAMCPQTWIIIVVRHRKRTRATRRPETGAERERIMANFNINGKLLDSLIAKGCDMMGWDMWALDVDEMLCAASYYVASVIEAVPAGCPTERMWERQERRIDALRAELARRKAARRAEWEDEDTYETMMEDMDMYAL